MKDEHTDLIWTPEDAKKATVFIGSGMLFVVGWMSFLLITMAPSCPDINKSPEYYYEKGKIEGSNGKTYDAIKLFTIAIKLKPNYIDAYLERAKSNLAVDSILNAINDYDSILVMKSLNVQQRGEYTYLKSSAHYLWYGHDSAYCKLVNEGCDKYGHVKCCDIRRIKCK